jgi:cyclic lactone autoinducer peptide
MIKKRLAELLLYVSKKTAIDSAATASNKGYYQPAEPEKIARLRKKHL